MSIEITIAKTFRMGDWFADKEDWDTLYADNLPLLVEMLEEDGANCIPDEAGGLAGIIVSARWVEDVDPRPAHPAGEVVVFEAEAGATIEEAEAAALTMMQGMFDRGELRGGIS